MNPPVDTSALRTAYRQAYAQLCYSWSDVYESLPDEADRQALIEDRAKLETLEFELRLLAPLNPSGDPSWPGGWLRGSEVHTPTTPQPRVWRTENDARAAGIIDLAWTPMCRIAPHDRWVLLDDHYWSPGSDDVLVTGTRVR